MSEERLYLLEIENSTTVYVSCVSDIDTIILTTNVNSAYGFDDRADAEYFLNELDAPLSAVLRIREHIFGEKEAVGHGNCVGCVWHGNPEGCTADYDAMGCRRNRKLKDGYTKFHGDTDTSLGE